MSPSEKAWVMVYVFCSTSAAMLCPKALLGGMIGGMAFVGYLELMGLARERAG